MTDRSRTSCLSHWTIWRWLIQLMWEIPLSWRNYWHSTGSNYNREVVLKWDRRVDCSLLDSDICTMDGIKIESLSEHGFLFSTFDLSLLCYKVYGVLLSMWRRLRDCYIFREMAPIVPQKFNQTINCQVKLRSIEWKSWIGRARHRTHGKSVHLYIPTIINSSYTYTEPRPFQYIEATIINCIPAFIPEVRLFLSWADHVPNIVANKIDLN